MAFDQAVSAKPLYSYCARLTSIYKAPSLLLSLVKEKLETYTQREKDTRGAKKCCGLKMAVLQIVKLIEK